MFTEIEILKIFKEFDTDGNRKIDIDEFIQGFKQLFPSLSEKTSRSLFKMHDKDNNKTLDRKELISLVRFVEKKAYKDDPFIILFDKCDVDHNGVLSYEEFKNILRCVFENITEASIKMLFEAADDNGDKVLNLNEYL